MKLTPAHEGAFEEDITQVCTDSLWAKVLESVKIASLPEPAQVTGRVKWAEDKRTWWQRALGVAKETSTGTSKPIRWRIVDHFFADRFNTAGRKGRKLVVKLSLVWEVEAAESKRFYWEWEGLDFKSCFMTDVDIFPLTPQQAAFVGARNLKSDSDYSVFWGTDDDVREIQRLFPIGLGSTR